VDIHHNTQLSQSSDLVDHVWTSSTRTSKSPNTSPRKRKRDLQWSAHRLTEIRMQNILHDYTHTQHPSLKQGTSHTDMGPGKGSGRHNNFEEVGIPEGGAEVGRPGGMGGGSAGLTGLLFRHRTGQRVSWELGKWGCGDGRGSRRGEKRGGLGTGGRRPSCVVDCVSCVPSPHGEI
jgi:hypothetical protein